MAGLSEKIAARAKGVCLYGIAPPKRSTEADKLAAIAARQVQRIAGLGVDGLVVYDIQDEGARSAEPRPFPFLPTIDPEQYAYGELAALDVPKIVYRSVARDTPDSFGRWAEALAQRADAATVLVGAPSRDARGSLALADAYKLVKQTTKPLTVGAIAIAERHDRRHDEHERILAKTASGCSFFVTQAVYNASATKSLLSDYHLALQKREQEPVPLLLTFTPCGSVKTLEFLKWLGISFPRWLENELRNAPDPLAASLTLVERVFEDVFEFAERKGLPLGINVESVAVRKTEIDASVALFERLQRQIR